MHNGAMLSLDSFILGFDRTLRIWAAVPPVGDSVMPESVEVAGDAVLTEPERAHAAALMRVNHVGEVCAQALYQGQAQACRSGAVRDMLQAAGREETQHLAWTARRLKELNARPSLLNPLWYGGAFALGYAAGKAGDALSLGFVAETERQVEQHLTGHLDQHPGAPPLPVGAAHAPLAASGSPRSGLPPADLRSRAIVARMREDEARHGAVADAHGAIPLPEPLRLAMRLAARVMTTTAYYV